MSVWEEGQACFTLFLLLSLIEPWVLYTKRIEEDSTVERRKTNLPRDLGTQGLTWWLFPWFDFLKKIFASYPRPATEEASNPETPTGTDQNSYLISGRPEERKRLASREQEDALPPWPAWTGALVFSGLQAGLKHGLFLGLIPACFQTGAYTINSAGSPACGLWILELLSLHNPVSQFLNNIYAHCWLCFSGDLIWQLL